MNYITSLLLSVFIVLGIFGGGIYVLYWSASKIQKDMVSYDLSDYNCSQILNAIDNQSCLRSVYRPNGFFNSCYSFEEKVGYFLSNCKEKQ